MKLILPLVALFSVTSTDKRCKGLYFNDKYYNVEIVKEGISNIRSLAYNKNDDSVYFVFDLLEGNTATVGYINLDTRKAGVIDGIKQPNVVTVDTINNIVFIGGADGIYRINDKKVPVQLPIDKDNIVSLFYKEALYFTNSRREAYRYINGHSDLVPELQESHVDALAIDKDGNIFFLENNLLLRVKVGTRAINTHEKYVVNLVTTDDSFNVFVCASDGVYTYDRFKFTLTRQANMRDLKALSFNKLNEPIYAVADKIFKLSINEIGCFED